MKRTDTHFSRKVLSSYTPSKSTNSHTTLLQKTYRVHLPRFSDLLFIIVINVSRGEAYRESCQIFNFMDCITKRNNLPFVGWLDSTEFCRWFLLRPGKKKRERERFWMIWTEQNYIESKVSQGEHWLVWIITSH